MFSISKSTRWSPCTSALLICFFATGATVTWAEGEPQRLNDTHFLTGSVVRGAFRDLASEPRKSAVRVLNNGKEVALGTIVGEDGWIVTKGSQLKGPIVCRLGNGKRLDATYVGYHQGTDLALLKVETSEKLQPIQWTESTDPELGQWLVSVGTGGRPEAVGVVSVKRRTIPRQPYRGVLGIEFFSDREEPVILRIFPESGAEAAGLQPSDRILKVNDLVVTAREQVSREIASHRPGDKVSLQVQRGDQRLTITATLTHAFDEFLGRVAMQNSMGGELSFRRDEFPAVIQHDSVLSPTDCGGPVVNLKGMALGINIARAGRTETYLLPHDVFTALLDGMKEGKYPPPDGAVRQLIDPDAVPPAPELPQLSS